METFQVVFKDYNIEEASNELRKFLPEKDIKIKHKTVSFDDFSLESPTLIVSGASLLSALISALLAYLAKRNNGNITILGSSGRKIEIPRNTPKEKIEYYVKLAKELDVDQIIVGRE